MQAKSDLWDDPSKDFRQRYQFPEQFIWDLYDLARIDYDGYMGVVLDLLPTEPSTILDVGCGPGLGSKLMLDEGHIVEGIDYSERAIAYANILVPDGKFEAADIRLLGDMTQYHNRFDAATHVEVFEHIPPQYHDAVLQGIRKAIKPGGRLIMSVPSVKLKMNPWHYKHFTRAELIEVLTKNGFTVDTVVNQNVIRPIDWHRIWGYIQNNTYDLRFLRRMIRPIFLKRYNITDDPERAGRYIVRATKSD